MTASKPSLTFSALLFLVPWIYPVSILSFIEDQAYHRRMTRFLPHPLSSVSSTGDTTECTEWQLPLPGVHFIMMVKSAHSGEQSFVYASVERADTLPLFLPLYICTLWATHRKIEKDRQVADGRGEKEQNHTTARKVGPL
jgi:hypothetical protein